MNWSDLTREETIKALKELKRKASAVNMKNKGSTKLLNEALFYAYLDLAAERFGPEIKYEVLELAKKYGSSKDKVPGSN